MMAPTWRPVMLFVQLALAALLLASWFDPIAFMRPLWDALDAAAYLKLNGTVESGDAWRWFWAAANTRIVDGISALLFVLIFGVFIIRGG